MATAFAPVRVTIGTGLTAIALAFFLDRAAEINNTKTGFTGAFHLGDSYHDLVLQDILLDS